jgi:hypothetical protein
MPKRNHYCDLVYEKPFPDEAMEWIEQLEEFVRKTIISKKDIWFSNELDESEIEELMPSTVRIYNSGKKVLLRSFLDMVKQTGIYKCAVFDEREVPVDISTLTTNTRLIPIIQFEGVRLASKSFDISVKLKQVMVLDEVVDPIQTCLIRRGPEVRVTHSANAITDQPLANVNSVTDPSLATVNSVTDQLQPSAIVEVMSDSSSVTVDMVSDPSLGEVEPALEEVLIHPPDGEFVKIKNPNEVYYELYQKVRGEAKKLREQALTAYLEANNIKLKYNFEDSDEEEGSLG